VFGDILAENDAMQKVCRQLGFELHYLIGEGVVKASINVGEIPRGDSVYCKDS
jgi:hypothetical protein